jgi:predicted PurR-regulated permease PerM
VRKDFQIVGGKDAPKGDPTPVIETARPEPSSGAVKTGQVANGAQVVVATSALLAVIYFARLPIVVLLFSALLAFMLEPVVGTLERRIPRVAAAMIAMGLLLGTLYLASYYSFVKAKEFAEEFPKYSGQIKQQVIRFRQQANKIDETRKAIIPDNEDKNAVRVKPVSPTSTGTAITETVVAISFIPFLTFFMLTWQDHIRSSLVQLFRREDRTTAYVTLSHISKMMRAFIAGNFIVGLATGMLSAALFWYLNIPYWYFIGLISGFLSLVPYLGVLLAIVPPLVAGISVLKASGILMVVIGVVLAHVIALNVLYPKVLGGRLQLNPLSVTVSLLFWGFLWGGVGLVLAIPITAAMKIVFEHVDRLRPLSHLLGEGNETSG